MELLGWEFAFELHETTSQLAAVNQIELKFKKIRCEVLEKRAVEQGDIYFLNSQPLFFELAALAVQVTVKQKRLTLTSSNFVIPPDDVPNDVMQAVTH